MLNCNKKPEITIIEKSKSILEEASVQIREYLNFPTFKTPELIIIEEQECPLGEIILNVFEPLSIKNHKSGFPKGQMAAAYSHSKNTIYLLMESLSSIKTEDLQTYLTTNISHELIHAYQNQTSPDIFKKHYTQSEATFLNILLEGQAEYLGSKISTIMGCHYKPITASQYSDNDEHDLWMINFTFKRWIYSFGYSLFSRIDKNRGLESCKDLEFLISHNIITLYNYSLGEDKKLKTPDLTEKGYYLDWERFIKIYLFLGEEDLGRFEYFSFYSNQKTYLDIEKEALQNSNSFCPTNFPFPNFTLSPLQQQPDKASKTILISGIINVGQFKLCTPDTEEKIEKYLDRIVTIIQHKNLIAYSSESDLVSKIVLQDQNHKTIKFQILNLTILVKICVDRQTVTFASGINIDDQAIYEVLTIL